MPWNVGPRRLQKLHLLFSGFARRLVLHRARSSCRSRLAGLWLRVSMQPRQSINQSIDLHAGRWCVLPFFCTYESRLLWSRAAACCGVMSAPAAAARARGVGGALQPRRTTNNLCAAAFAMPVRDRATGAARVRDERQACVCLWACFVARGGRVTHKIRALARDARAAPAVTTPATRPAKLGVSCESRACSRRRLSVEPA